MVYKAGFIAGSEAKESAHESNPQETAARRAEPSLDFQPTPELSSDIGADISSSRSHSSEEHDAGVPSNRAAGTTSVFTPSPIIIDDSDPEPIVASNAEAQTRAVPQGARKRKASDSSVGMPDIPRSPKYTSIAPLRQPTRSQAWYSKWTFSDEAWLQVSDKRTFSHIGYIEETDAGMVAPQPCYRCSNSYFPKASGGLEKPICMVYKPRDVKFYTRALGNNWRGCSRCMRGGGGCSFIEDANDRGAPTDPEAESAATGNTTESTANDSAPAKRRKTANMIAPVRRPTRTTAWYSKDTKIEAWHNLKPEKQRHLSHIGYMEETDAGMAPPKPCGSCSNRQRYAPGGGTEKLVCRVYRPETAKQYTMAKTKNWMACSNCWHSPMNCTIVMTEFAKDCDAARARGDPIDKLSGPLWKDADLLRYAAHSGKRPERQPDGSVHFVED